MVIAVMGIVLVAGGVGALMTLLVLLELLVLLFRLELRKVGTVTLIMSCLVLRTVPYYVSLLLLLHHVSACPFFLSLV